MITQRRITIRVLITGLVLMTLLAHGYVATAAPPNCPPGQVWLKPPGMCVPQEQAPGSPESADTAPAGQPSHGLWSLDTSNTPAPDPATIQGFVAQDAIVSLSLWHFACDAGTDPRQAAPDWLAACTGASKPAAEYELYTGATKIDTVSLQTTDGAMGQSTWSSSADQQIAAGNLQFLVRPLEGWESTWVTCRIIDETGKQELRTPGLNGTAFAILGEPGDSITCAWFLVATTSGSEAVSTPQQKAQANESADTSNTLTVTFLACPESVTRESDQTTLEQACARETNERPILLTIDDEASGAMATGAGTWTFAHAISVDIGLAHDSIPHCFSAWPATTGQEAAPKDTFDTVDGNLTITVGHPETTVTCEWFVFQT